MRPDANGPAKACQALLADAVHRVVTSADKGQAGFLCRLLGIVIGLLGHGRSGGGKLQRSCQKAQLAGRQHLQGFLQQGLAAVLQGEAGQRLPSQHLHPHDADRDYACTTNEPMPILCPHSMIDE